MKLKENMENKQVKKNTQKVLDRTQEIEKGSKQNEGITLIALVVTIVVLLILAGITLTIVLGENGIINQAKKAEQSQKLAEYKDIFELAKITVYTKNHGNGVPIEDFWEELENQGIDTSKKEPIEGGWAITPEEGIIIKVKPTEDGKNIEIDYELTEGTGSEITIKAESIAFGSSIAEIETGSTATLEVIFTPENTSNKGLTWISSNEEVAIVTNGKIEGLTVGTTTITATTVDGSNKTITKEITVKLPASWDTNKVTGEKVDKTTDGKKITVPVPKGFVVSGVASENTVDNGLVIYEGTQAVTDTNLTTARNTRNQFVWVPVPEPSEMYGITEEGKYLGKLYIYTTADRNPTAYNWREIEGKMSWESETGFREPDIITGDETKYDADATHYANAGIKDKNGNNITNANDFKKQLEEEFKSMIDSVVKYKGFYIGRYETGSWHAEDKKAKIIKNNSDIVPTSSSDNEATWYAYYQKSKQIVEGRTSMIWGSQWDACLKWFLSFRNTPEKEEVATYVINSTGKGNYEGTQGDANKIIPTGSNDKYSVNNIYDMAGNAWDWTLGVVSKDCRALRRR